MQVQKKGPKKANDDEAVIYRDDLVMANAMLFAGATNSAGITASVVTPHADYGCQFWRAVAAQPHFGEAGWDQKTLLAEPVMIKALAQLAYTFHGSREENTEYRDKFLDQLLSQTIDFSHKNTLWDLYFLSDDERNKIDPMLASYLTPDVGRKPYAVKRDDRLDFGPNTRDIARYLGDLIRWQLKLPPRRGLAALKTRLINQGKLAASSTPLAA